ncbi:rho GTPase-activating protein gacZ-like [Chrysoperla carnea]|uniref:rho GTPase-activating protein gacZ-like n=1 Tax=Chrysoperla carnea TaxID=189513 RepID=UPI001D09167A|nr:rho GTPase-activating protein gacZ-like [Chrysoperla carnea]
MEERMEEIFYEICEKVVNSANDIKKELKSETNDIKSMCHTMQKKYDELETKVKEQQDTILLLQKTINRNNLIIHGLHEFQCEKEDFIKEIVDFINEKLEMNLGEDQVENPPALKRPRTREDFYLFCTYVLEHENYNRQEEPRQSTSPMDSAGLVSDSNLSSGQEDSNKPTDEDTGQYSNYVDSESYDLVTCYCNKPFAGRPMIECSNCLTWVHLSCAKIRKKHIPEVFYCAICKSSGNQNISSSGISSGSSINGNSIVGGGGDNSGSNSPNNTTFVPINQQPSSPTSPSAIAVSPTNQTVTSTPTAITAPPVTSPITTQKSHRNNNFNKNMKIASSLKSYKNTTLDNHNTSSLNANDNGITRVRGNTHTQQQYVKLSQSIGGKNFNKHNINRINMGSHQKSTTSTNSATVGGYKRTPHS